MNPPMTDTKKEERYQKRSIPKAEGADRQYCIKILPS